MSGEVKVKGFKNCARCGGEHGPMSFAPLGVPMSRKGVVTHTHWASCPSTGEPILLIQGADDVPARPDVVVRPARADGSVCRDCGGMTVPTGACSTCSVCGSTGGCG